MTDVDVVLLAINGAAMAGAIPSFGSLLDGKTVIDATNNVAAHPINSIDVICNFAPNAHVFRAFNSLGWENFADPVYGDTSTDMLYSGPPGAPQEQVEALIRDVGIRPIRVGDNDRAGIVDDFVKLWFTLAFEQGMGRGVGFKILSR